MRIPYHFTGRCVQRDGEMVLIGTGLDISEQRESMRVTNALLRRNQALMQSSMEGIHVLDIEGNVVEANAAFCNMLGYTRDEALRLNVADWDAQWTAEELRGRIAAFIGKSGIFETVHRRKDGSLLDVEICVCGIEIDGAAYLFASGRDITGRKQAQAILERHQQVLETALDGYWMTDEHGVLEEVNEAYAAISGYTAQELIGMRISQLEAQEKPEETRAHVEAIKEHGYDRFETRHRRKDGRVVDIEVAATFMQSHRKFFVFCRDITLRKQAERELRVAAITFESQDAVLITDADANILRVNRAFSEITGYSADEVLGKNPRIMNSGRHERAFYIEMWQQLTHAGTWSGEVWDRRKNGEVYPKWTSITAIRDDHGETVQYVAIFSDITERKKAEEEIRNLAFYDPLTSLPNRRLFLERLRAALPASARHRDYGAVMFLDMDKFKLLNDTLGHDCGDLLLVEVASRIKSCVREMDTVARLGGDEFTVLIEGIASDEQDASRKAGMVAEKIREALAQPYQLKEHEYHSTPSIGIALYHGNADTLDTLLKYADLAMYQAKNSGRNAVRFFDPVMQSNAERHDTLESDLRLAVRSGELRLYYQVQVDNEQRPVGAEALLRWEHPGRGMVMPDQFIPVAEESALIVEIGNWVLDQACAQLARWQAAGRMEELALAVNISPRQFARPDFVAQVATVIERHRIVPARLKLELTESVVAGDLIGSVDKIRALRELGIGLSMDDFDTVYSSLYYLKQVASDQIKIHRDVVQGISSGGSDAQLVQAIVDLATDMHLDVYAEGVETEAQLDFLKQHGCMAYQGYLFGKPLPLDEFEKLLEAGTARRAPTKNAP
jgi:diguanylate cyclase (GGDEF)-like protein/PAS domain S-box-containing protein